MRPAVLKMGSTLDGFLHGRPVAASPVAAGVVLCSAGMFATDGKRRSTG